MRKFLVTRVSSLLLTLFLIMTITFALFRLMPGDPTLAVFDDSMSEDDRERVRELWGLNEPLHTQYFTYLVNAITFKFDRSFISGVSVQSIVAEKLMNSLVLMGPALGLSVVIGGIGGALVGWKRGSLLEKITVTVTLGLRATPVFFTGIMIAMVFAYQLRLFPSGGMMEPGSNLTAFQALSTKGFWLRVPLPLVTISLYLLGGPLMLMRTSILEVKGEDFMEVHLAKGLSEFTQIKHAARNAILPMVTYVAMMVTYVFHGQVVIETIFSWPGIGRLLVQAILDQDYPVAEGAFFLMALTVVIMTFIADLAYGSLDPRVVYE
jgi:peptide/nickel transport system permease protein